MEKYQLIKCTYEVNGNEVYEEYKLYYSDEAIRKLKMLKPFEDRKVHHYCVTVEPDNWDDLSKGEREELAKTQTFDIKFLSVFYDEKIQGPTLEEIEILKNFPELEGIKIDNPTLKTSDLDFLMVFKEMEHLNINGNQFNDEIIDTLSYLENLELLDLYNTSVSEIGFQKLKTVMSSKCKIFGKYIQYP